MGHSIEKADGTRSPHRVPRMRARKELQQLRRHWARAESAGYAGRMLLLRSSSTDAATRWSQIYGIMDLQRAGWRDHGLIDWAN